MKRDMELIRKILLAVQDGKPYAHVEDFSDSELKYHQALAIEAGLVEGSILKDDTTTDVPVAVMIKKLTWSGHDFIDAITSELNWQKVKDFLKEAGKQITLETVKFAVKQLFGFGSA
jgi:hypothetical protein